MAQPNYSTSEYQYVDEETMSCGTPPQSPVTLFPSEYNAMPKSNYFDQYSSTGQNLPSDNPYSHLYPPEYGVNSPLGLSPAFAEMYMNCDEATSPGPTSYNLLGLSTSTSNVIYNQTSECQRDSSNFIAESGTQFSDLGTSGTISSYIENKFPAFCHSNNSLPSQPELVKEASSSFNITNLDSHDMSYLPPDVDQQCIFPTPLPPIHSIRMPTMSMPRFQYSNGSPWISPTPETTSDSPKSESLLPPPTDKAQVPTSESSLPPSIDKAQVKVRRGTHMCTTCKKVVVSLKRHYQTEMHKDKVNISGKPDPALEKPEFYCEPCDRTFESSAYFTQHNNARHDGEKPHKCSKCGKRFKSSSDHDKHKAKHEGTKPFKCDTCSKEFNYSQDLGRHRLSHTRKKYVCDVCKREYDRKRDFAKHIAKRKCKLRVGEYTSEQ